MIVYVGKAGERNGREGQRSPQGLRGRLGRYETGKAATSGFGEAALDRSLADPVFVRQRLAHPQETGPERTITWSRAAIAWFAPDVRWTTTSTGLEAETLERSIEALLLDAGIPLWNRPRRRSQHAEG